MDNARALFEQLTCERPGDSEVRKGRLDALVGFHVALNALALDRRRRGKAEESAVAQKKADDYFADLSRERPDDPEVVVARRQALLGVADLRREVSRWGETYLALSKSESMPERLLQSALGCRPADQDRRDLGPSWLRVR